MYIVSVYTAVPSSFGRAILINRSLNAPGESFKASIDRRRPCSKFARERENSLSLSPSRVEY